MREDEFKKDINEGLGELADLAERDHEVQMARAQLYKLAKYSIKLHDMLKGVSEAEGLEGWVQSKITKASDYLGAVYHHLDYDQATGEINDDEVSVAEAKEKMCPCCDVVESKCTCKADCPDCNCKNTNEGRLKHKSYKQGVKAARSSGKKGIKHLRKESLEEKLAAKLESKKKIAEKAKSKAQQRFMGMVHAMQKGEKIKGASPELKKAAKTMPKKAAKDYAKTKHKGKPEHVKKD